MKKGIIWSYTKGEFVIFDHYYFSILYKYILDNYLLEIPTKFNELLKIAKKPEFKTIIFNYPEKKFTSNQIDALMELFNQGKTIMFLTYYKNEDNSSQIANSFLNNVGLFINYDEVTQKENIHNNDEYLILTNQINPDLSKNVSKVIFPCSSSITINQKTDYEYKIILQDYNKKNILISEVNNKNKGKILAFGSCVFWDNFSLILYDNFNFVKNILEYACVEVG